MDVLKKLYKAKFPEIPQMDSVAVNFLEQRGVTKENITDALSDLLKIPYFDIQSDIQSEFIQRFNKSEMLARRIFPVRIENSTTLFIINEFPNRTIRTYAEEYNRSLGKKSVDFAFLLNHEFDELLESLYLGLDLHKFRTEVKPNAVIQPVGDITTTNFDVENIAEIILAKAFENRASDIHLEPLETGFQVRYRIDGQLSITDPYTVTELQTNAMINHFKLKSGMRIEEHRKGQDGQISDRKYKGNSYDLRLSTILGTYNEKIVIRVFVKNAIIPDMQALGFTKFYTNVLHRDMERHAGLILTTGSTGSGKSTTLLTLLSGLDAKKLNIYTIEDPVERIIPYVNHVCIKKTGVDFDKHLETLLRQDPDVIAIGEIRNLKTMEMAIEAALTGNLVFATLHTNGATESIYRLLQMGVEPYQLAAALLGISSQRLVRTLCPYCSTKRLITAEERQLLMSLSSKHPKFGEINLDKFEYLYDANGCNHCNYTGYRGRFVVAEYLSMTQEIKNQLLRGDADRDTLIELSNSNFIPIEIDALNKVLLGKTTLSEVLEIL